MHGDYHSRVAEHQPKGQGGPCLFMRLHLFLIYGPVIRDGINIHLNRGCSGLFDLGIYERTRKMDAGEFWWRGIYNWVVINKEFVFVISVGIFFYRVLWENKFRLRMEIEYLFSNARDIFTVNQTRKTFFVLVFRCNLIGTYWNIYFNEKTFY